MRKTEEIHMNDLMNLLKERRTYRRFCQKPISEEILAEILTAARYASSAANKQPLRYVVVKTPKKVQEVIEVIVWILVMISICMIFKLELDRTMKFLATGQSTTMLKIPKFYIYGVVVVCCAMMVVNHALNGIEDIKKLFRKGDSAK